MESLSRSRRIRGLLAAMLGVATLLTPVGALELAQPELPASPALSAPSPTSQIKDPATDYRAAAASLGPLVLTQEEFDILWGRFGPQLTQRYSQGELDGQRLPFLLLPHGRPELIPRYLDFAAAHPQLSLREVATQVNMGLDAPFYTQVSCVDRPEDPLVLVNKYNLLPQDFVPRLTPLGSRYGSGSLTPEAAVAFIRMSDAAREDGLSLRSVSAYRSYATQNRLYRDYVSKYGQTVTETFSAQPGYSEHQTGLALDINVASTRARFQDTQEYAWLVEHCAQYGFLLRYPEEKQHLTGYRFEPWHYRYVGAEIAQVCMEQGLTYEEYLAQQPAPGEYQVPQLLYQGQPLPLGHGALVLDGSPYLSLPRLAPMLGWTAQGDGQVLSLFQAGHTLALSAGRRYQLDGQALRLSQPVVALDGELYLALSDLPMLFHMELYAKGNSLVLAPQGDGMKTV